MKGVGSEVPIMASLDDMSFDKMIKRRFTQKINWDIISSKNCLFVWACWGWGIYRHRPLTTYVKLRVAHALGMPGTFSPPPTSNETASERSRHASRHVRHARAVMHVGISNPQWRGKRSRHSRCMRNPQFYVSGTEDAHGVHYSEYYLSDLTWIQVVCVCATHLKARYL